MARPFLTARWSNVFLATYAVPPEVLERRLPAGLALDSRGGQAFASLVAFDFLDTRVLGVSWPGYRNFSEINLRFYVRREETGAPDQVGNLVISLKATREYTVTGCYNSPQDTGVREGYD